MRWLLLAVVLSGLCLAGCSSTPTTDRMPTLPSHAAELPFSVSVTGAHVERGECQLGLRSFDEECHVFAVTVALPASSYDGPILPAGFWKASRGTTERLGGSSDAPDRVDPGSQANFTVRVTAPQASAIFTKLTYSDGNRRGEGAVPAYAPGPSDDDLVKLHVATAQIVAGRCFDGAEGFGDECHKLTVDVDNSKDDRALDVGVTGWSGVAGAAIYDFMHVTQDGPSAVSAGKSLHVTVAFTLPASTSARLDTLRLHDAKNGISVSAAVPAY